MDELNQVLETQLLLLTRSQSYWRRLGIRDVTAYRFEKTWHTLPIPAHWGATVGMWGGIQHHAEIMKRAGASYVALKSFRQRNGLITAQNEVPERWELAASAYIRWKEGTEDPSQAAVVASRLGILPVELRIYVDRVQHLMSSLELLPGAILEPENYETLRSAWEPHDVAIDGFVVSSYSQIVHG